MKVVESLGRIWVVGGNTFLEAVRQRFFAALVVLSVGLVGCVRFFREFNFGASELRFVADFGFGALVFFGSALTVVLMAQVFFAEVENRTVSTLLAKPIGRGEFLLGKFFGVFGVVGVFCALITGLVAGLLFWREGVLMGELPEVFAKGRVVDYAGVFWAGLLQWVKFGVLGMLVLWVASFSSTNLFTVLVGFAALVVCHLQYLARGGWGAEGSFLGRAIAGGLGLLVPNFQVFNLTENVVGGGAVSGAVVAGAAGYGVFYMVVFGGLAVWSFRGREI